MEEILLQSVNERRCTSVEPWLNSQYSNIPTCSTVLLSCRQKPRAFTITKERGTMPATDYVMKRPDPKGSVDPDTYNDDLKVALRETGKLMKGTVKKIRVVNDRIHFSVEPTTVADKIVDAIKASLKVEVNPASSPLDAFTEKYGLAQPK